MGSIDGPPAEIGEKVGAALVGTFLGILMCYGFLAPLASSLEQRINEDAHFEQCIKAGIPFVLGGSVAGAPWVLANLGKGGSANPLAALPAHVVERGPLTISVTEDMATAMRMHFAREVAVVVRGYEMVGNFTPLAAYVDKRPLFYPGPGIWPSDGRTFNLSVGLTL